MARSTQKLVPFSEYMRTAMDMFPWLSETEVEAIVRDPKMYVSTYETPDGSEYANPSNYYLADRAKEETVKRLVSIINGALVETDNYELFAANLRNSELKLFKAYMTANGVDFTPIPATAETE